MHAYLFPRIWPLEHGGGTAWTIAGSLLVVLGLALFAWRGIPAITGREWRPHPDPAHLRPPGQRGSDAVGAVPVILFGIGVLQHDAAWHAAAGVVLAAWLGTVLVVGFTREAADPHLPKTTADIVTPESDPVLED